MANKKGQALVIVLGVLSVLFIVGMGFFAVSQIERNASIRHLDAVKAHYVAEAGVAYAQKVLQLERQDNLIDCLDDISFTHFQGQEVDLDGDATAESKWFNIVDSQSNAVGRFAVKIIDEASKVNVNSCEQDSLEQLFAQLGLSSSKAQSLMNNRPYNAIEEISAVLGKNDFNLSKDYLSVYSRDFEIDLERERRSYLNSPSAQVILDGFLCRGVKDAHQKAANLKDASDQDVAQTIVDKYSASLAPSFLEEQGGWEKVGEVYEAGAGSAEGKFVWTDLSVDNGQYYCFLYGSSDTDTVGTVYTEAQGQGEPISSGEGLLSKIEVASGRFELTIKPSEGTTSRFSHVELVSKSSAQGLAHRAASGTEAVVINELMVKPSREVLMDAPVTIKSGKDFNYIFKDIEPGDYHLSVIAKEAGGLVGTVTIEAVSSSGELYDGDYFPSTVTVDENGHIHVKIKNNTLQDAGFSGIKILQEPDIEFIELLNLSPQQIDISNFSFEAYSEQGEILPGWPGRIPQDTYIMPYQYLVFVVDNRDIEPSPQLLRNNKIYFQEHWGFTGVALIFDEFAGSIDKTFDLLPNKGGAVLLKDASGKRVDKVEYTLSQVKDFTSLERADPTAKSDSDTDGMFDGWYPSEAILHATPGLINENLGMYSEEGGLLIPRNPSSDVKVFNRALADLSEVKQLSNGESWCKFSVLDVSRIADRFACSASTLALTGRYKGGEFIENAGIFESSHKGDSGVWEFSDIASTTYLLSIVSDDLECSQNIQVGVSTGTGDLPNLSPLLFVKGFAFYGSITLPKGVTTFQIKIVNDAQRMLGLKEIQLEPVDSVTGRININTAKQKTLKSILESDSLVQTILSNRPLGIKDGRQFGVGDAFILDSDYISYHNNLTVKSDVYEILCRGEFYPANKTLAYQIIRTVLERGD